MSKPANILSKYESYSYYHVLAICDRSVTATALSKSPSMDVWSRPAGDGSDANVVVSVIEGTSDLMTDKVDGQYVILINGSTDANFVIEKARWMGVTAAEATSLDYGTSCAMEGTLTIQEPRGVMFCDQVVASCLAIGVDSANAVWVLKTFFIGYGVDSQGERFVDYVSDITPLHFIAYDLTGSFTEAGGSYEISFVSVTNGATRLPQYSRAVNGMTFAPGKGLPKVDLRTSIQRLFEEIEKKYTIHQNCFMQYVTAYARQTLPQEEVDEEIARYYPVAYKFKVEDSDFMGPDYLVVDQPAQFKDDAKCFAPPTFKTPSNIDDTLHMLIRMCPQINKEMVDGSTNEKGQRVRYEYKIISTIETKYEDAKHDHPTALVTYSIKKYAVPKDVTPDLITALSTQPTGSSNSASTNVQPAVQNLLEFDYIYSGQNTDILSFDMKLEMGLAYLQTATVSNTFSQQADALPKRSTQVSRFVNQTRRYEDGTGSKRRSSIPIFFGTQIRNPYLNNTQQQSANMQAAWTMSKHASLEVSDVTMTIMGNPRLLGSLNRTSGNDGMTSLDSEKIAKMDPADVAFPHWTNVPAYAKVNIYMPSTNDDLALMQMKTGDYAKKFWFDGFYYVIAVEHIFEDGTFTQQLNMLGLPQSSDFQALQQAQSGDPSFEESLKRCSDGGSPDALECPPPADSSKAIAAPAQHTANAPTTPTTEAERTFVASSWQYKCVGPELMIGWTNVKPEIQQAINDASAKYPFINGEAMCTAQYMAATAYKESTWREWIVNSIGAAGLYQFTRDTWDGLRGNTATVDKFWKECNFSYPIPAKKTQAWYDKRLDPKFSSLMVTLFTRQNMDVIKQYVDTKKYGGGDLYMAHVLGAGGAKAVLRAINDGNGHLTLPAAYDLYLPKYGASFARKTIKQNPFNAGTPSRPTLTETTPCYDIRLIFCWALYSNTTDTIPISLSNVGTSTPTSPPRQQAPTFETYQSALTPCQVASAHSDKNKDAEKKPDECDATEGRVLTQEEVKTKQQREQASMSARARAHGGGITTGSTGRK